ncbi:hypothetical protein [Riemerella columbipharyngis]|uniref:Uncharacterized protein n=1 Tax=Riemerella columbipharyngis TaxID=1071918 RepID=A0A1G7F7F4_9FLAO|nr:hypothetical protein [Riemerella columbipharyngis]SDE71880.1 hypothetical protein SAMN05421544_12013 [Riemerella columbipharyngis]
MEEPKPQNPIQVILGDISENLRNIHLETSALKREVEYLGKRETIDVDNELQRFKKELDKVSSEMDKKYLSFLDNFKQEIAEKSNVSVSIDKIQMKEITDFNRFLRGYWYIPLAIMGVSLIIASVTSVMASNFYKKSISTKERVIIELKEDGQVILPREEVQEANRQLMILREWRKLNPKDSKSLDDFELGWKMRGK